MTEKQEKMIMDPQYMDNHYSSWYMVPWPDCQIFDEMEGAEDGTISTWIGGVPVTFVDPEWLFGEEQDYE